jgi:hypothetical protein
MIDVKLPPRPIRIHEKNIQSATFHTSLINIQTYKISRIVYPLISDTPVDAESSGLSTDDIKSGGRTFSPTQKSGKPSKTFGQSHFNPSVLSLFVCPRDFKSSVNSSAHSGSTGCDRCEATTTRRAATIVVATSLVNYRQPIKKVVRGRHITVNKKTTF